MNSQNALVKLLSLFTVLFGVLPNLAAQQAFADFPQAGFSISPPDGRTGAKVQVVATFLVPIAGAAASNVNVMIVVGHADFKSFSASSRKQLELLKAKVSLDNQTAPNLWVMEYVRAQHGIPFHFYQRSAWKDDRVYVATATATEADWPKVAAQLKASVDSLKLK